MNTLFLQNKYTHYYYKIVTNAQQQNRKKLKRAHNDYVYYEKHHIVPTALGGPDVKDNWVILTAREHFICHWLLTKMTLGNAKYKMIFALNLLCNTKSKNQQRYNTAITSRVYAKLKEQHATACSIRTTGRKATPETLAKMSAALKGRKYTVETLAKMSAAQKARQPATDITRAKMSAAGKGKIRTAETKAKMSAALSKWQREKSKLYTFVTPDGFIFENMPIVEFCEMFNLSPDNIRPCIKKNNRYKQFHIYPDFSFSASSAQ